LGLPTAVTTSVYVPVFAGIVGLLVLLGVQESFVVRAVRRAATAADRWSSWRSWPRWRRGSGSGEELPTAAAASVYVSVFAGILGLMTLVSA
jgi:hypothetical protein